MDVSPDVVAKVITELENDRYKWRTVRGVARVTGLQEDVVKAAIKQEPERVIQSTVPSNTGEELFTTRRHFRKHGGSFGKLIGAFKGRAR